MNGLAADDAAAVEHVEGERLAGVAVAGHHRVEQQRRAGEHGARRGDPAHLDVALGGLAPDADGEDRHARGLQRQQRRLERAAAGVGAVADHDQAGQRHAGQLLAGVIEGGAEPGVGAGEGQVLGGRRRRQAAREAQRAHREAFAQRPAQPAVGRAELVLDVGAARLAVQVGDAHAARVVEQHADDVLVRHGGAQHQHRPEQADEQQPDQRGAQRRQHDAVAGASGGAARAGSRRQPPPPRRAPASTASQTPVGGGEAQLALVEDDPAHAEEELGQPVEHGLNRTSLALAASPVVGDAMPVDDSRIAGWFDAARRPRGLSSRSGLTTAAARTILPGVDSGGRHHANVRYPCRGRRRRRRWAPAGPATPSPRAQAPADLVLVNGKVITVDPADAVAQAVAISGGRIAAVGSTADVKARIGPRHAGRSTWAAAR